MKRIFLLFPLSMLLSTSTFANPNNYDTNPFSVQTSDNITATINKDTTEEQIEQLISYFKENNITVDINKINYNDKNEIVGLKILLKKDGQQSSYSINTNIPIQEVELGYKDGQLFVTPKGNQFNFNHDDLSSLMQQFDQGMARNFDFSSFFNDENFTNQFENLSQLFQNSSGSLDELMEQMKSQLGSSKYPSTKQLPNSQKGLPKYSFINVPDLKKLIIIDGKESNFETLNTLAENNLLDTVDSLKPSTAKSLYGKKAKDGAIIATTIQK